MAKPTRNVTTMLMLPFVFAIVVVSGVPLVTQNADPKLRSAVTRLEEFYLGLDASYSPAEEYEAKWTIEKFSRSVCQLKIRFEDFNVRYSDECVTDFLQIISGGEIQNYCGNLVGQDVIVNWDQNLDSLTILLVLSSKNSNPKLKILVTQEMNSCTNYIGYSEFYITTQGFNQGLIYPSNALQEWFVVKNGSDICHLQIKVATFDVQPPSAGQDTCLDDMFIVEDVTNGKTVVRCGKYPSGTKWTMAWPASKAKTIIPIQFITDSTIEGRGFSLLVSQLKCNA